MKRTMAFAVVCGVLAWSSSGMSADTYTLDPAHTTVGFSVRHLGINDIPGKFTEYTGAAAVEGDQLKELTATVQTQSIDTGVAQRDTHLRSADFFDAARFPAITFKSKRVEKAEKGAVVVGDLTLRGVTKEVRLPVTLSGPIKDPWGNQRIGIEAKAKLNRRDFGVNFGQNLPSGVAVVADEVEIRLNAEAVKAKAEGNAPAK